MTNREPRARHSASSVHREPWRYQGEFATGPDLEGILGREFAVEYVQAEDGTLYEVPQGRAAGRPIVVSAVLGVMWLVTIFFVVAVPAMVLLAGQCGDDGRGLMCTADGQRVAVAIPMLGGVAVGIAGTVGILAGGRRARRIAAWGWLAALPALCVALRLAFSLWPAAQ
ncbi:hypothetical protein [Yinghuangia soli]|uniref:Uncharacterized protein n=1 Tax=Yinghuangia soli TaxID=2908204 RepID=A0AA41PXH9_9ACTN|nr:hypothetical protein [Yinghuangia soli]MCF2526332.1 hypothetical protein [Yinghuangia soli]